MTTLNENEVAALRCENERLKKERDFWHNAWIDQRIFTGKAWWEGYRSGIAWLRNEASNLKVPYV